MWDRRPATNSTTARVYSLDSQSNKLKPGLTVCSATKHEAASHGHVPLLRDKRASDVAVMAIEGRTHLARSSAHLDLAPNSQLSKCVVTPAADAIIIQEPQLLLNFFTSCDAESPFDMLNV